MLVGAWGCPSLIWETGTTLLVVTEPGVVELGGGAGGAVVVVGVVVGVTTGAVVVGVVVSVVVGGADGDFVVGVVDDGGFGVVVGVAVDFGAGGEVETPWGEAVVVLGGFEHTSNNWLRSGRSTCTCFGSAVL
jgi:hypothetical protein